MRFLRVISDVLDFSKVEAGKLELEIAPLPLRATLEECVGLFKFAAAEKGLRLICEIAPEVPAWVGGDQTRLRQLILNLISNAMKFTAAGQVEMVASLESANLLRIAIEVRDTGIGVDPEKLPELFSAFHQADASINASMVERALGCRSQSTTVSSALGQGAQFRFVIPMGTTSEPSPQNSVETGERTGWDGLRVLVAEDNVVNQKVVTADLVADGAQAVAAAINRSYDLIFMDVQMPEMDGIEATRRIRKTPPADRQPTIVGLTAHATTDYRKVCLNAGMDGYLTKPLDRNKLEM